MVGLKESEIYIYMLLIYLFIFMCLLFYICRMVDFVYGSYLIIIILCYLLIEMFYLC